MEEFDDDVNSSENNLNQLLSSLKSNKQVLRKLLPKDDLALRSKKAKLDEKVAKENIGNEDDKIELSNDELDLEEEIDDTLDNGESEDEEGDGDCEIGQEMTDGQCDEVDPEDKDEGEEDVDDDDVEDDSGDDGDDDDKNAASDSFKIHFEQTLDEDVAEAISKAKFEMTKPVTINNTIANTYSLPEDLRTKLSGFLSEVNCEGTEKEELLRSAGIKEKLITNWKQVEKSKKIWSNKLHNDLFQTITSYKDLLYSDSTYEYWDKMRHLYVLHITNHVLKSRNRILKNNAKMSSAKREGKELPECRDQGLTSPKVLVLVPYKNFCLQIVKDMIKMLFPVGSKSQIMKKKRFMQEFSPDQNEKESKLERPDDFNAIFEGNIDDCFRLGISLSKNTIKLYSEFYSADIIIASPLGLRTIIGGEGEKQDYDFLSSIEILVMDHCDIFLMQNWEHVMDILGVINQIPKQSHGTDYSRVRMSFVNGWAKHYRQTLLFSSTLSPELNGIFNRHCGNYNGKVKYAKDHVNGTIAQIAYQMSQVYQRIECPSFTSLNDKRFNYFINSVLPDFKSTDYVNTAIYVPSYFDFVRLRNYFKKENLSFVQISEYSQRSNITRSRSLFLEKKKHFLIFTERFHFFFRYRLRGIKHLIFYDLPQFSNFYPELINNMTNVDGGTQPSAVSCSVTVLYSKFDGFKLEGIVGKNMCKKMMTSSKDTHMMITGD